MFTMPAKPQQSGHHQLRPLSVPGPFHRLAHGFQAGRQIVPFQRMAFDPITGGFINQYAYSTPATRQFACKELVDKAAVYGVEGHSLEGNDLAACLKTVGQAVERARNGKGPQLVVARLLRLCGHGEHDDSSYIDARFKTMSFGRDCLKVAEEYLLQQGWVEPKTLETWREEMARKVEEAVATVQRE